MTAPPCTQNRSYLWPLFPSLWASAPKQTHPLKCPPERRFAPARLPHSGPLNTAKVAASSDKASLHPAPACSQSCSANSRAQALPLQLWLQSYRSSQIASCCFSFPSPVRAGNGSRKFRNSVHSEVWRLSDANAGGSGESSGTRRVSHYQLPSCSCRGALPCRFPPPPSTSH